MSQTGSLKKLEIVSYKSDDLSGAGQTFAVAVNPASYSHSLPVAGGTPQLRRPPPQTLQFELLFDGTGVIPRSGPAGTDDVVAQVGRFRELTYGRGTGGRPYLKLVWGTLLFKCRLSALDITYTLFKPDGTPLRARANTTFEEFRTKAELERREKKKSAELPQLHTVRAGETLPLICYQTYGSSTHYPQVADANGLTDFPQSRSGNPTSSTTPRGLILR